MIDRSLENIRVLVVDDETPARQRLIDLLRQDAHVTAVLEASDGLAAVAMIEHGRYVGILSQQIDQALTRGCLVVDDEYTDVLKRPVDHGSLL
jgi:CheY-like chemotaxis protein